MNNKYFAIITFYQFKIIKDKNDIITKLKDFCKFNKIKGTILIADEGINGTIAVSYTHLTLPTNREV